MSPTPTAPQPHRTPIEVPGRRLDGTPRPAGVSRGAGTPRQTGAAPAGHDAAGGRRARPDADGPAWPATGSGPGSPLPPTRLWQPDDEEPPARRPRRRRRLGVAAVVLLLAGCAVGGVVAFGGLGGLIESRLAPTASIDADQPLGQGTLQDESAPADGAPAADAGADAQGAVDSGSAEDGTAGLDPELLRRYEAARKAAAADGITMRITSGRRSAEDQQALVDDAIRKYGDEKEAHRWVAPPEGSAHVHGTAVDVGPTDAAYWMEQHGSEFGLCRVFANEIWHYEATIEPGGTCGPLVDDASGLWR